MLTAERLRELLDYDPETGVFRWKDVRRYGFPRKRVGQVAGSIDGEGYILINIGGTKYGAHRLAWLYVYGRWPQPMTDHRNGVRHDNRFANLREASRAQNKRNERRRRDNTSGHKGVVFRPESGRWRARISVDGSRIALGTFDTREAAAAAYASASSRLHADFARLE